MIKRLNLRAAVAAVLMSGTFGLAWGGTLTDADGNVWTSSGATITAVTIEKTAMTIPDEIDGTAITAFNAAVFKGNARAVRVTIPATVTAIPAQAFQGCANLKEVTVLGEGLKSIGKNAFQNCPNLAAFTIPNSVTTLGQGVFSGCSALEEVTIGDGVTTLTGVEYGSPYNGLYSDSADDTGLGGSYANALFYNCTSLKTINWGADIRTIGNIAFLGCTALEEVDIPDTVTSLGSHAFLRCSNLQKVTIGNKVPVVNRMAFRGLSNLTDVTFGSSVTEVGQQAFQDCVNLHNFTLPGKIQYLRYRCFAGCNKALTAVTIPTNADDLETVLGQGVFSGCTKLETVTFGDTLKTLTGVEYGSPYNGLYSDSASGTGLGGSYANALFYNCTSLKTINWGAGVKTIGDIAFLNCKALTSVTIPNSVSSIGNHAFYGCSGLRSAVVGGALDFIGRRAFANCASLHWVDFRGDAMAAAPGTGIFDFDRDRLRIYAAKGSTGWGGIAGEAGLPASGSWSGVPIAYAPPPDGSDAPYDFYYPELTDTISRKTYAWPFPVLLTTNAYVSGKTVPTTLAEFVEGSPVYLTYAVNDYWHSETVPALKNHFRLTGARSGGFDLELSSESASYDYLLCENATPELLQTLEPGEYTLTCTLNNDNALSETDYSNNVTSFTFTVTASPVPVAKRYTITYEGLEGAENVNPTTYTTNDLPFTLTGLVREGYEFLGWQKDGAGAYVTAIAAGTQENLTLVAAWKANEYEVVYEPNGGEGESVSSNAVYDVELEVAANAFTRTGYAFVCWSDADGNLYKPGDQVKNLTAEMGGKVSLRAEWEAISYTLVYAAGGGVGEPYATNIFYDAEHVVEENWFVKEGATFLGWTDAEGKMYLPGDVVSNLTDVAEDVVTFTAKWCDDSATDEQKMSVSGQGWHEVSFAVLPESADPADVFAPVEDKVGYVTYGSMNWNPLTGGTLMALEIGKGYWVQTTAESVEWTVTGRTNPDVEIALKAGWNLIGYPLLREGNVETVLATALATEKIDWIYSGSRVYPGTLTTLTPGKGYWVYANAAVTIKFDAK